VRLKPDTTSEVRLKPDTTTEFRRSIFDLNHELSDSRYLGGLDRLEGFADGKKPSGSAEALYAALSVARELSPMSSTRQASEQIAALINFLQGPFGPLERDSALSARDQAGRDALIEILRRIAGARRQHHDPPWTIADLAAAVRRWIGEETFPPPDA